MEMTVKELARLEKEKSEEIGSRRRVRRLKKESCPLSPGEASLFAEQPLVKGHSKKLSSEEMKKEKRKRIGFNFVNLWRRWILKARKSSHQILRGTLRKTQIQNLGRE